MRKRLIALLGASALAVSGFVAAPASAQNPTQDCIDAVDAAIEDQFGSKQALADEINKRVGGPGELTVQELNGAIRDVCD